MNIIEILFIIIVVVLFVLAFSHIKLEMPFLFTIVAVSLILFLVHVVLNTVRWQFYLMYLMFPLSILILYVKTIRKTRIPKRYMIPLSILGFLLLTVSITAVFSFPMYEVPTPQGDYLIGTTSFVIDDETREERYSDVDNRRYMIQLWYPAETIEGYEIAPWLEGGKILSRALAKDNWLPGFALDHTVEIDSNSYYDAPVSSELDAYPIVVISHGWRGFKTLHTDFAEELASQGYIVVSIDHTYGSVATVFGEDDYALLNLDALPPRESNADFQEDAKNLVDTYTYDIIGTLDYLVELNQNENSIFYERLDIEKIGLLGHSTGGGAGVNAALNDPRVDAVFGLDAWVEPVGTESLSAGLNVPSVFLRSGSWETGENNAYLYTLMNNSTPDSILYQIDGTTHYDFAMVYMYSPLTKYIGFTGTVESGYLTEILKESIIVFFDSTLYQDETTHFDSNDYEEMHIIVVE